MKDQFPGWNPATEDELHSFWTKGTVAVDANVLLNAYRYSQSTRNDLLTAFEELGDRLWLPHRAAEEFHRNRLSVLIQQRLCAEHLDQELTAAQRELTEGLEKRMRDLGRRDTDAVAEAVRGSFKELRKHLKAVDREHHKGLGDKKDHRDDPLYDRIVKLLSGKVGEPFDETRMTEIKAEAEQRLTDRVPPGLGDADKDDDRRHGDVVVWFQLIEKARESKGPIIFVTDDQKDWMWEVKGQLVGPMPALVAEMADKATQAFHVYSTAQFVRVASDEGEKVDDVVLQELESPKSREVDEYWIEDPETGQVVKTSSLRRWGGQHAKQGRFYGGGTAMPSGMQGPAGQHHLPRTHLENIPPTELFAINQVTPQGAQLRLHDVAGHLGGLLVACRVMDPNGLVHQDYVQGMGPPGGKFQEISTTYPSSFGNAPELVPGPYRVEWFAGPGLEPIARDFFVIP